MIDRLLKESEVLEQVGFSHTTLWRKVADGTFPAPVKPSPNITRWKLSAVQAYIEGLGSAKAA